MLVEVTEQLCPPEDVESVSDLSAQALYYYGKDDLKHCFIVIGEKHGSEGSDYPLRELISRRSITKAVPMKDPVTGQVKTETITVNGPISLAETTTKGDVNPENLSRSFVVGIDESEDQTRLIHDRQRTNYTVDGFLERRSLDRVTERHHFAQRLLEPVLVFNPYAEVLTFPASTLKTRRDHEKFLRLINAICFLYQQQLPHPRRLRVHPAHQGAQWSCQSVPAVGTLQRPRFPHHDPQPRGSDCQDQGPTCRCGRGDLNELNTPEHSGSDAVTNSPARR